MQLKLTGPLGDGGFADVWKAKDGLGRDVAVKIVRASAAERSSALDHARALARTRHPNVVSVFSLEKVTDPQSKRKVDAVVMEFVSGETLETRLQGPPMTPLDALRIGTAVADAIAHIHGVGLEHGDLHEANIIVSEHETKVIDILYFDTLAILSSGSQKARIRRDLSRLKLTLQRLISHTDLPPERMAEFAALLTSDPTATELREAFEKVVSPESASATETIIADLYNRFTNDEAKWNETFTAELLKNTPSFVTLQFLAHIVENRRFESKQEPYFKLLWDRLTTQERSLFRSHLAVKLDYEIAEKRGAWLLLILSALDREGWPQLPYKTRALIERVLVKDVANGTYDDGGSNFHMRGALGTWAGRFWPYFEKPDLLLDALLVLLNRSRASQDYVGAYFLSHLQELAEKTNRRDQIIRGLRNAVHDKSTAILKRIDRLPKSWVAKLQS